MPFYVELIQQNQFNGVTTCPCDLLKLTPNKNFINKVSYFK